jgi:NitT/TauT family transport system permease protein
MATRESLAQQVAGLDALEMPVTPSAGRVVRFWRAAWPKLAALALALAFWQVVVWSGWRPAWAFPGPATVFRELGDRLLDGTMLTATAMTMRRAFAGYALAVLVGVVLGSLISRIAILRSAVGSLITGLQTMPSIAWFPLAILLFKPTEGAIMFVMVLGAAPAIANGLIAGTDHIPPLMLRAGRVLGAKDLSLYRHVILPASLPAFLAGLKQGWAFAWRSLMAGELLVIIANRHSIGEQLEMARQFADSAWIMATMMVILVIGILVDSLVFGVLDRAVRRRWGLIDPAT